MKNWLGYTFFVGPAVVVLLLASCWYDMVYLPYTIAEFGGPELFRPEIRLIPIAVAIAGLFVAFNILIFFRQVMKWL